MTYYKSTIIVIKLKIKIIYETSIVLQHLLLLRNMELAQLPKFASVSLRHIDTGHHQSSHTRQNWIWIIKYESNATYVFMYMCMYNTSTSMTSPTCNEKKIKIPLAMKGKKNHPLTRNIHSHNVANCIKRFEKKRTIMPYYYYITQVQFLPPTLATGTGSIVCWHWLWRHRRVKNRNYPSQVCRRVTCEIVHLCT